MANLNTLVQDALNEFAKKPKTTLGKDGKPKSGKGQKPLDQRVADFQKNASAEANKLAEEIAESYTDSPAGIAALRFVVSVLPKLAPATGPKINPDDLVNLFDQKRKYTGAEVAEMLRKATG